MKLSFTLIVGLLVAPISTAPSQTLDSALALFPLDVGNEWQYSDNWVGGFEGYFTISILGDTLLPNGKVYRLLSRVLPYGFSANSRYLRIDSATANIYHYDSTKTSTGGESLLDSLRAGQGNRTPQGSVSFGLGSVFGITTMVRGCGSVGWGDYSLAYRIGPVGFEYIDLSQFSHSSHLIYARIDGREYGTRVSVKEIAPILPKSIVLCQNYPNPFNPSTTIRYSLPGRAYVTLTVFNTLGQQVANLVDEVQALGEHSVIFDASRLSSGVYFYRLQAGEFFQTKRLVILR